MTSTHTKGVLLTWALVQYLLDDGLAEHRICQYYNLVLYSAKFLYIYQGEPANRVSQLHLILTKSTVSQTASC